MAGKLNQVQEKVQQKVGPVAQKISTEKHLTAIRDGLMMTIPLTIIGGFSQIIAQPPVPAGLKPTNFILAFLVGWRKWAAANAAVLQLPYNMTIGLMGLFAALGIAYALAKEYKINAITSAVTSLLCFLSVCSPAITVNKTPVLYLPTEFLGAKGLFTAILIGLISVEITRWLLVCGAKIKMPDSVPPAVAAPFESLIPALVNLVFFIAVDRIIMAVTTYSLPQAIMKMFTPIFSATDSLPAVIIAALMVNLLWFFGIHGGAVFNGIMLAFLTLNMTENSQLIMQGKAATHIFSGFYVNMFINIGGSGCALALGIAILIVARSSQLRSLSKVAIVPSVFGISEPFVFGTPLVMNPYLLFPMIIAPLFNAVVSYLVCAGGLMGKMYIAVPFSMPVLIAPFLATMDFRAAIVQFMLLAVNVLIYIPFVKMYDQSLVKAEAARTPVKGEAG